MVGKDKRFERSSARQGSCFWNVDHTKQNSNPYLDPRQSAKSVPIRVKLFQTGHGTYAYASLSKGHAKPRHVIQLTLGGFQPLA